MDLRQGHHYSRRTRQCIIVLRRVNAWHQRVGARRIRLTLRRHTTNQPPWCTDLGRRALARNLRCVRVQPCRYIGLPVRCATQRILSTSLPPRAPQQHLWPLAFGLGFPGSQRPPELTWPSSMVTDFPRDVAKRPHLTGAGRDY